MPVTIEGRPLSSRSTPADSSIESSKPLQRLARLLELYGIARTLYAAFRRHLGASSASRGIFRTNRGRVAGRGSFAKSTGLALGAGLIVYALLTLARHVKRHADTDPR